MATSLDLNNVEYTHTTQGAEASTLWYKVEGETFGLHDENTLLNSRGTSFARDPDIAIPNTSITVADVLVAIDDFDMNVVVI